MFTRLTRGRGSAETADAPNEATGGNRPVEGRPSFLWRTVPVAAFFLKDNLPPRTARPDWSGRRD